MNIPFTSKKLLLPLLLLYAISNLSEAQSIGLLKDINTVTTNNSSNPQFFASTGSLMCFAATTDLGTELWVSDGTSGNTRLLKDINPGTASAGVSDLFAYNGIIYFSANDGVNGKEIWRTDGTMQGTYLFKDINIGSDNSNPGWFAMANGTMFFTAVSATNGLELWKSDGTVGGTVMVKDIRGGTGGAEVGILREFNGKIVFTASASDYDSDPYISDGTAGGTFKLANINPVGDTSPGGYVSVGSLMYFFAHNYSNGYEPWVTDGTTGGTRMLKNINLQPAAFVTDAGSNAGYFTPFNGYVYFTATDGLSGTELYRTDGTNAGTVLFKDINLTPDGTGTTGSEPSNFIVYSNALYFTATDGTNYGLWKTDGTVGGTVLVKTIGYGADFFVFNNTLYFTQYDTTYGNELWKSDGTAAGTVLVKDLNTGSTNSNPENYFIFNGSFYFSAFDEVTKNELWKSDGTNAGTNLVKDINLISGTSIPGYFTTVGSESFFIANDEINGAELWKTDGTNAGTTLVKDIRIGSSGINLSGAVAINNTWVAALSNGSSGLWKSDGTESGTSLLKALGFYSGKLTLFNNYAYFNAKDGTNNYELWKTDGTVAGTSLVIDIAPSDRSSAPQNLTASDNTLFFTAQGGTDGFDQLYKTDGTAGGTVMIKDFGYAEPTNLVDLNGTLLFTIYNGSQLWKSNGTEAGTALVKELNSSIFSFPSNFTKVGNYVFFAADDGTNGLELWRTDGTSIGTAMLKDINTTAPDAESNPNQLLNLNGTLYFVATDGINGRELWKTDGTANGTVMVKNCNGTSTDSNVENLTNFNGTLYFTATNAVGAKRLWKTDGTLIGTIEINGPSEVVEMLPTNLSVFGSKLIFSGLDAEAGIEPFIFDPSGIPNPVISDQPDNASLCATGSTLFTLAASNATTYLWQVKIGINAFTDLSETGVYSGVNTATLNISNVSGLNGYQYRCVVSNGFVSINSNAATLTAITPSAPTGVSVNNTNICSGNSVSLTATCAQGAVRWYNQATGGTLVGTGSPLSQSPTVNTTYYAECSTGYCESSRVTTSTVNVTTSPLPPSGISISDADICNGSSTTLTGTCTTGTIKWYTQATGGVATGTNSPRNFSPTVNTTYYAACDDGTCQSPRVLVAAVTVNAQPTTPGPVSFSQSSICEGTSINLTTSCSLGTVIWYNEATGGVVIGTGSPFTHSPSATRKYYATCKTDYCESNLYTSSQVNVSPVPLATGVSVNTTSVCSGQSVTLTATCSAGTVRWYTQETGGSFILTGSPVNHSPTVNTTYYASCRVGACERERIATDAVVVTASPGNPSSVSVNNTAICSDESVSLTAICSSGTITWYNQATGGSAIGTGSPLSQNPASSGRYYASCKNGVCESNRGQTSQITVTSVAAPTGVSVNPTSICSGESVTLTATCSVGTIRWYTQATGGSFVDSGSPVSQSPTVNTIYYASCRSGSCESSRVATNPVTMASPPTNPTGVSVNNTNVCFGESVSLTANCATGTVNWYNQATGGSALGTGSPLSQNVAASTTYYASCKTACNESSRVATSQVIVSRADGGLVAPQSNSSTVGPNTIFFYKTTISQSMTVDSIAVIISANPSGGARVKFGIYSDTAGVPDALLASSSGNSNTSLPTLPTGTSKFPLVSNIYLNGGTYWIAFILSSGEQILHNASGANAGYYKAQTFSNALPATGAGVSANSNQEYNVYFSGNVDCAVPNQPTSVSATPNNVCEGNQVTLLATCATGVATWYGQGIGGTALGTGSPLIIVPTNTTPGQTQTLGYFVSCKNGANESNRISTGSVTVISANPPTVVNPGKAVYCQGESVTLTTDCQFGTIRWYDQATGGTVIGTSTSLAIPNGLQSTTAYYATCNVANCESGRSFGSVKISSTARKYVKHDATGANDGSSWQNAYTTLQPALDASCDGTEIWVAEGTYYPTRSWDYDSLVNNRVKSFFYSNNLLIYGGFEGNETLLSERNIEGNPTILSGDFNNDDIISGEGSTLTITNNTENAHHVFIFGAISSTGVIDGFTIKGGNADDPNKYAYGGGILYLSYQVIDGQYEITLSNMTFIGNSALRTGGGVTNFGEMKIKDSKFIKNKASSGGGLESGSVLDLSDVSFEGNLATYKGGGLAIDSAKVTLNRGYFKNNYAQYLGGGYAHEGGSGRIDNTVFTGNSAGYGGAFFGTLNFNLFFTNTTIAKNTATYGGGLVYSNLSTINLKNSIIWGNTASGSTNNAGYFVHPFVSFSVGTPALDQTNSMIQGFGSANGNLDANPLFNNENDVDGADNKLFTADDGFNLTACSPAINAGTNTGIEAMDILNNARPYNSGLADIGAFEYAGMPTTINASVSQTSICSPTTISLSASCSVGTVTWYNQATGGVAIGTGSPLSQTVSTATTFYASCKDACGESSRTATQQITYGALAIPAVPVTNPSVCINKSIILSATCPGGTVSWYNANTTTLLFTGQMYTTPNLSTNTTYKVRCESATCSSDFVDVNVTIAANPIIQITGSANLTCAIASVTRTASGGSGAPPAGYQWSNGLGNSATATMTAAGTYTVTVTNTSGCTTTATTVVTQDSSLPSAPTITAPNPKVVCAPSTLTLTASGCAGTVSWSNGSSGTSLTLSSVGTYSISATCTVGSCTSVASSIVTGLQIVNQPSAPTIIAPNPKIVCAPSTLTLTASGCAGTITWSNGSSGTSLTLSTVGTYSISATCTVGSCTSVASSIVTGLQIVNQPSAPTITAPNPKVVCAPSTLTLTASGCAGTVIWSNGSSGTSLTLSTVGTYSISATCTVGSCTSVTSSTVTGLQIVNQPSAPTITSPNPKVVCAPSILVLTASGCAGTVTWSNGSSGTSLTLSTVGTYSISATCSVGSCTSVASSTVTGLQIVNQPSAPTIIAPNPKVVCAPSTLTLTASGCAGTVSWSNGSSGTSLTLSTVGTYSISATCSVGSCTSVASSVVAGLQIVNQPSAPTITAPNLKVVCAPSALVLTASGCAGTVSWSNGSSGTSLTLSTVGTYSISATCSVGSCTSVASSTVTGLQIVNQPSAPTITVPNPKVICSPSTLVLTASGCAGTIAWSNGSSGTSLTLSTVGTYSISATCTIGSCTSVASSVVTGLQIVNQPSAPTITSPNPKVVCAPGILTLTASGCAGTVTWSNGSSGTSLILSTVGTYSISATCAVGSCMSVASSVVTGLQIVNQPSAPTITAPNPKVVCAPGTLTLTASGCAGTIIWSNGSSSTSLILSTVGTYSISATCTVGSCTSVASSTVTGLQIVNQPSAPTIIAPNPKVVCAPSTLTLTASGCAGTVSWSNGSSGTSLTLSTVGTYSISATCAVGSCTSVASSVVTGLQIVNQPSAPIITAPNPKVVCSPSTLVLTASNCAGTVTWSNDSSGTSLTLSTVGTYSISATCTVGSCTSVASSVVTGLQIVNQPSAPTITAPNPKVVCAPGTLTLTASGCAGIVNWSNGSSGTSLILSTVGTYSISATCTVESCTSVASSVVSGLQIVASPVAQATNTGPYSLGQTIELSASGGTSYSWVGPDNFTSNMTNPTITNALAINGGVYTVTVFNNSCTATATTQVIVNGSDPCAQVIDLLYVKGGNPYQPLFSLKDGMTIQYTTDGVSIMAVPICPVVPIGSVDLTITGPNLNWTILQNVEPFTIFDNLGSSFNGRELLPGTYTFTVTGYPEDNRIGGTVYGPIVTTFTIVGNSATISAPTVSNNNLCAGSTVNVTFAITGSFNPGNSFTIQLSDSTGSFVNPTMIGSSNNVGTVVCQLPQKLSVGGQYLIRVVSSNQVVASSPTASFLSITPANKNLLTDFSAGTTTEQAALQINASNKITSPANVTYYAGKAIILNPGFEARGGSIFKAQIQACSN